MKKSLMILSMVVASLLLTGCFEGEKDENPISEIKPEAESSEKVTNPMKEVATAIIESVSDATDAIVEKTKELVSDSNNSLEIETKEVNSLEHNQTVE